MNITTQLFKPFKKIIISFSQHLVKLIVAFSCSRYWLNKIYIRLNFSQKSFFHQKFSKIFRNSHIVGSNGIWVVDFQEKKIKMPLTTDRFWLDWDSAISIVGNDIEVKETYLAMLSSPEAPQLFIDIGANYGTHSLLFLVHDIKAITFEPNSSCHDYFKKICELNKVEPCIKKVALGDKDDDIELSYPKHDTWFGSTNIEVISNLTKNHDLITEKVKQKMLDDYLPEICGEQILIKIDTEGNEYTVLQGALKTLQQFRPKIIFECWSDNSEQRKKIFNFFGTYNYIMYQLPWKPRQKECPMTLHQFTTSSLANFIAVPTPK